MKYKGGFIHIDELDGNFLERLSNELIAISKSIGAITSFVGIVRETSDSEAKEVIGMEVEHWEEKGEDAMTEIAKKIGKVFGLIGVRIFHVYGMLKLGDPIVYVVLASEHRKEAFEAMEEAIHLYKTESPVWKKEVYNDGTEKWIFTGK